MATGNFPPVGQPITQAWIDGQLSGLTKRLADLVTDSEKFLTLVLSNGGLQLLAQAGYSNSLQTSNPNNPGGMTDAAYALSLIDYMSTMVGVANGTATQATEFNFMQALSVLTGGF
jgi:hypothetical protein